MMTARSMAVEMASHLAELNDAFRAQPLNADKLALLASDPAERILTERLTRLLELEQWSREDLLDLSGLFFLMASSTD